MSKFMNSVKSTMNNRVSITENGAVGYKTTGHKLLDCNFKLASFRNMNESSIIHAFAEAYAEHPLYAIKWLFFARDREEGSGERRTFRILIKWLASEHTDVVKAVLKYIPEYGRMDDVWAALLNTAVKNDVIDFIANQLKLDNDNMAANKTVSLCAKWLPSCNTSSRASRAAAKLIYNELGLTEKEYRKMLSALRKYLDVIEVKLSDSSHEGWATVDYEKVPSLANLKYRNAFLRNDETRRREYLGALEKGTAKINAAKSTPVDIVHQYGHGYYNSTTDKTLEAMWQAIISKNENKLDDVLVVVDGSGSMDSTISDTSITAHDVANALGLYFAEINSKFYKNQIMTFGGEPQLVNLSKLKTLRSRINELYRHNDCANTNIVKLFRVLLESAINNNLKQSDMPKQILIISDMEFDGGCYFADPKTDRSSVYSWRRTSSAADNAVLFKQIENEFAAAGYQLPGLVFWNTSNRSGTIPLRDNALGIKLLSGFSPAILDMVMSNKLDPYEVLIDKLNTPRYQAIEEAVKNLV